MSYKEFGLQEKKTTRDKGSVGKSFCLWCASEVKGGFSMCFANFVICEECARSATEVENLPRWEDAEECHKCRKKSVIGFRSKMSVDWPICKDCIDWAKKIFDRNRPVVINSISELNANKNMQGSGQFETVINAHLQELAAKDSLFAETLKKPGKNIKDCVNYIMNTVRKSGRSVVLDAEVFGMAVHYYDEDKIDIGGPVSGSVSSSPAKSEPKKAPSPPVKPAKTETPKKEVKQMPSLFDL